MKYIGYIIILLLVILGVTFAVLNSDTVAINYYANTKQMPLSLALAVSLVMGVIIGVLVMSFKLMRLRFANRGLRKKLQRLEKKAGKHE